MHACLEGPEAGVYYRGIGEISNGESTQIELPNYVDKIACNFTIQITPIYDGKNKNKLYESTKIESNKFSVYGPNGTFYWIVYGERSSIEVEPLISETKINGDGPYLYVQKN